jgi:hypothetical protein
MSVPPIPPQFGDLGHRSFSFYPPIVNVQHNEWRFRRATWSEILVVNTKSGEEVWVPRRFLGETSRVDEPIMIVGLKKELEYKAGSLWPSERRVIEMPRAVNQSVPPPPHVEQSTLSRVVGIRLEGGAESRSVRLIVGVMVAGILACVLLVSLFRDGPDSPRVSYRAVLQSDLGLRAQDDYFDVVQKLGPPGEDRWRSETGEMQYRILSYPQRSLHVILMGAERDRAAYIGALDQDFRPVHAVELRGGRDSRAMLRTLGDALRKKAGK